MKFTIASAFALLLLSFHIGASAQQAPVIINPQNGTQVNLIRAHWDANVDIANINLQCDFYSFNNEAGSFEKGIDFADAGEIALLTAGFQYNTTFTHNPLPDQGVEANSAFVELPTGTLYVGRRIPFWSVVDGVYKGIAPLSNNKFVEIVAHNASQHNAVRVWYTDRSYLAYHVCYNLDGAAFQPSGVAGGTNTALVDLGDFQFRFPAAYDSVPEIINKETGQTVELVSGEWRYNQDIASRSFFCDHQVWDAELGHYEQTLDSGYSVEFAPYDGEDYVFQTYFGYDNRYISTRTTPIDNLQLPGGYPYMELTESGYRTWLNSDYHVNCGVRGVLSLTAPPFSPGRVLPAVANQCDYSDAEQHNGWGWNQTAQSSCPPENGNTAACDYTDAARYNGWGWNSITSESCAPQSSEIISAGSCDYSNAVSNNGWGWNAETGDSCAPLEPSGSDTCDYQDAAINNGWGWDGVNTQSCAPRG